MDQKAYLAIAAMLNAFPQGNGNPDVTMRLFEAVLRGVSSQAVIDAAQRFASGLVEAQSLSFAPSTAEFATEARKLDAIMIRAALPRGKPAEYISDGRAPFERSIERAKRENEHRPIIQEHASFEQFQALSKSGQLPPGASWVAALATIYGPS